MDSKPLKQLMLGVALCKIGLLISVNVEEELFESTTYEYDFGFVHLTTFICHLIEGVPTLTEHVNIKWLPSSKLGTLEWAPADIPTVEKLKTTL